MVLHIDTVVEGGLVVTGGEVRPVTIAIGGDKIVGLLAPSQLPEEASQARRIDATGKIVIPGVIDAHAHLTNFNEAVDSFTDLGASAAFGGVTTFISYMLGKPGMSPRQFLTHWRDEGERESVLDFSMHCRLTQPQRGITHWFEEAFELGVTSIKMFMAYRKKNIQWDDYSLFEAMEYIGSRGGIFCCHAESGDMIDYLEDKYQAAGRYTPENYLAVRPPEAEAEAVYRILKIAKLARCPVYLVHVSSGEAIALANQAREAGQEVWIETCPQYLLLTDEDTRRLGGLLKIAPPVRDRDDVEAVWQAVSDGTVDVVGSDHAPWPLENKSLPPERFPEILFGAPGIETMLPLLYSEGVAKGRIDLPRMVELLCEKPARTFGLAPRKGSIAVGADADLVLIDPEAEWTITADRMHSKTNYTPYEGWSVRGKVERTILRGQTVVQDGKLLKAPGYGRFLPRSLRG